MNEKHQVFTRNLTQGNTVKLERPKRSSRGEWKTLKMKKRQSEKEGKTIDPETGQELSFPSRSDFTPKILLKFLRRLQSIYRSLNKKSPLDENFQFGQNRISLITLKEKKQIHTSLNNYTKTVKNKEFILCDDKLAILDFKRNLVNYDQSLYKVWQPMGQPWWYGYYGGRSVVIAFLDFSGLIVVEGRRKDIKSKELVWKRYHLDTGVKGHFENDSCVSSQRYFRFYAKKFLSSDEEKGVLEVKEVVKKRLREGKKGYRPFCVKSLKLRFFFNLEEFVNSRIVFNEKKEQVYVITHSKILKNELEPSRDKEKLKIKILSSKTKKVMRSLVIKSTEKISISKILVKGNKIFIQTEKIAFLINTKKLEVLQINLEPGDYILFTEEKDYTASPSNRVKFIKGLTIVDTNFIGLKNSKIHDVVKLKKGDILIKIDFGILRFYYNLTKDCIEYILRVDLPSELASYFDGVSLHSTPNIIQLRKFYLKTFDFDTKNLELTFHREFKNVTKDYSKRFENIQTIENSEYVYLEATRIVDTSSCSNYFNKMIENNKKFKNLYCLEYQFITKKTFIYNLPCGMKNYFVVLGEDFGWEKASEKTRKKCYKLRHKLDKGIIYIVDSKKRLIRLKRHGEEAEYVDISWANFDQIEGEGDGEAVDEQTRGRESARNRDNFGYFSLTGKNGKYIFYAGKVYFCNGKGLVFYDLYKKVRSILVEEFKNPGLVILHHQAKRNIIVVFDNSDFLRAIFIDEESGDLKSIKKFKVTLNDTILKFNMKFNYVHNNEGNFTILDKSKAKVFEVLSDSQLKVRTKKLKINSDIFNSKSVEINSQYYKIISGECLFNLSSGEYKTWQITDQFSYLVKFLSRFCNKENCYNPTLKKIVKSDFNYIFDFLEKLYNQTVKFKQMGFQFFELGLNFSKYLAVFGDDERLSTYVCTALWIRKKGFKGFVEIDKEKGGFLLDLVEDMEVRSPKKKRKEKVEGKKKKKKIQKFFSKIKIWKKKKKDGKNKAQAVQVNPNEEYEQLDDEKLLTTFSAYVENKDSKGSRLSIRKKKSNKVQKALDFFRFDPKSNELNTNTLVTLGEELENSMCSMGKIWYYEEEVFGFGLLGEKRRENKKEERFKRVYVEVENCYNYCLDKGKRKVRCLQALKEGNEFR